MDETIETKRLAPEIVLIGILLLLSGISDVISDSVETWHMLSYYSFMQSMAIYAWEMPGLLLAGASIMCGVGLLRNARWSRKATIIVLIGLIGYTVIYNIFIEIPIASRWRIGFIDIIESEGTPLFLTLRLIVNPVMKYVILLSFLILTGINSTVDKQHIISKILSSTVTKLRNIIPIPIPAVIILIALILINHSFPTLLLLKDRFGNYFLYSAIIGHNLFAIMRVLDGIVAVGSCIAGVGLLRHAKWSLHVAVSMLLLSCGASILANPLFHTIWPIYTDSYTLIPLIGRSIVTLLTIAGYVVMMVYLIRHWPRTAEPEMATEVN